MGQCVVQINLPQHSPKYVDVNKVVLSFQRDPDLASIAPNILPSVMQQLYIVTGCDYISFVAGIGKATFLHTFFQHANFITGTRGKSDLSMTDEDNIENGFLAFVRLIGTLYFKKDLATVVSILDIETPDQLYNRITLSQTNKDTESGICRYAK